MLALLFPGQGSQEVGMGREVCEASDAARSVFADADRALGFELSRICFEGPEAELRRTEIQQPAILATSIALLRALEERTAVDPHCFAGHSLGEYSALVATGALPLDAAVALVHARGRFMQEAVAEGQGAMAAILGCEPAAVAEACETAAAATGAVVAPANWNSPQQTVIAGTVAAVEAAGEEAKARGARRVVALDVSAPFHCALMEPAADKLAAELAGVTFSPYRRPLVTNVEAEPNSDSSRTAELLRRQVTAPVRFTESVRRLVELGTTRILEVGPGRVLSGLVARIDRGVARAALTGANELEEAVAFVAPQAA
ncbi:MAG: ACP S-malonyltransferase [Myxococcota bacterium]